MKIRVQLVCVICLFAFQAFAQPSTLTVFSEDGDKFWLILNGEKRNAAAQSKVVIPGQTEPFQKMRIIFEDEKIPTLNQSIQFVDINYSWNDVTYAIKQKSKGKYVLRLSGWKPSVAGANRNSDNVPQTQAVEENIPAYQVDNVNPSTNTNTTSSTTVVQTKNNLNGANFQVNDKDMGVNFSMNMNMNDLPGMNTSTTTTTTQSTTGNSANLPVSSKPAVRPNPAPAAVVAESTGCSIAMSSDEFADAKKSISSKGFEDTKLQVAKQIAKNNCLNTGQVKEIIQLFGFEDTKLNFAKLAYDRTVDKKNYYKVGDVFGFSSSVDELNQYIDSK